MTEAIGWFSSVVLLLTIVRQVAKQYQDGSSKGVSKWLFLGQLVASVGFATYSVLIGNWVFVVTNVLTGLSAIAGLTLMVVHRAPTDGATRRVAGRDDHVSEKVGSNAPQVP